MKKLILIYSFITWGLTSQMVQAQSKLYITSFHGNGMLTWSNVVPNATCDVEWASSPEGPWANSWETLKGIPIGTNTEMSASVPMFYRVVMTLPPPEPPSSFEIAWCALQWPLEIPAILEGVSLPVYGRVYAEGLTDLTNKTDPAPNLVAEAGYGPEGSYPEDIPEEWVWVSCPPNKDYDSDGASNEDEYKGVFIAPKAGTYDFAFRFSDDGGETWHYADSAPHGTSDGYAPSDAGHMGVHPEGMTYVSIGTNSGTDPDFGAYSLTNEAAFSMDETEVTKAQWDEVYNWAVTNGYGFDNAGLGKALDHPVHTVSWYDCIKWCNARSEKNDKPPCYTLLIYVDGGFSRIPYRTGEESPDCDLTAGGYRLPTSDEWEYAARGGLSGKRFPWSDTINHDNTNYKANNTAYSYDTSSYMFDTYHPDYDDGGYPYTSPSETFMHNEYGLYDMAGNVWEWCNTVSGSHRSVRGGSWDDRANYARCGHESWYNPITSSYSIGFRTVHH